MKGALLTPAHDMKFTFVSCKNIIWSLSTVRETNAPSLSNVSAFWAGRVENWPRLVKFSIEHIKDIYLRVSAPEI